MVITAELDLDRVPSHIACVMDGNGRWAQSRGLPRTEGHRAGEEALFDVVEGASGHRRGVADRVRVQHRELAPARR